jgi:hypothetical protein
MKPVNLISLTILIFCLNGCVSNSQAGVSVGFEIILSGVTPETGVSGNRKVELLNNQRSYAEAVSSYSKVPAKPVDFSANQVVLLAAGEKPTGGYAIRVDSVEATQDGLKLNATETRPGKDCMVTQALTAPYLFVKVLSVKRIETVVISSEVVDCTAP